MKKHNLKISTMSVLCVLCAGLTTNAMAAASVRSLGGAGTYDGTSAVATSTRAVAPTRAGSLRISPAGTRLVTTNNSSNNTTSGTTTGTTQRLSIGKYLGGATTVSTGGSSSGGSGAGVSAAEVAELQERIDTLEESVGAPNAQASNETLSGRIAAIEDQIDLIEVGGVQGSQDGVVEVSNNGEVSINVDKLVEKLEDQGAISSSRETEIRYTSGNDLQWRYTSGSAQDQEWKTLLNASALTGDYATSEELATAVNALATKEQLNDYLTTSAAASAYQPKGNYLTEHQSLAGYATTEAMNAAIQQAQLNGQVDLSSYDTAAVADTKYQPKGNYLTEHQSLAGLATTEQLAAKANASDLSNYLTSADAATTYQPKGNYLTEHQSLAGYATTDQLATKANASDLSNYLTSADAATTYQPKGNYLTEHQSLADYATTEAMNAAILQAQLDGQVDLSSYDTAAVADTKYQPKGNYLTEHQSLAGLATTEQLAAKADAADLADYLTETDAAATYQPKGNYLTEHQSLSAYETAEQAGAKYQPIGSYATTDQLATKANASDLSNYLTSADAATTYQPKGNYLTEHQSLADYATIIALNAKQDTISDITTIRSGATAGATALQPADIAMGSANGTIAVDGTDVAVKGLGNVAYADATLPDTSGDHILMVNRGDNGTYTYRWEDASSYTGGGSSGSSGGEDFDFGDDSGW